MGRLRSVVWVLVLTLMGPAQASAHPADPRDYKVGGASIALGAALVFRGDFPIALFEFYAHPTGLVVEQAPRGSTPNPIAEAWVAAMYYPYSGTGYRTQFVSRSAQNVALNPSRGGVVTFPFPGVGSVHLELRGSTATPDTFPQGLTTPGGHHGHSWNILAALVQGKPAYVGGYISHGGFRDDLRTLYINGPTSWIAQGATGIILAD